MRRLATVVLASLGLVVLPSLPAASQTVEDVAEEVAFRGYFIEEGSSVDFDEMERLLTGLPTDETTWGFVALAEDPAGGTDLIADQVLASSGVGTVMVISPGEFGAVSSVYDDAAISEALDAADSALSQGEVAGFEAFATSLSGQSAEPVSPGGGGPGVGGSGWIWLLVIAVGLLLLFWWMRWSRRRREEGVVESELDEARAELNSQTNTVSNQIIELSDKVQLSEHPQAIDYYRQASDTFAQVHDELEKAATVVQLEALSDRLDTARWQLEACAAVLEGRPVPSQPEQVEHCFFDPTHGAGTEEAEVRTPAGDKEVRVCRRCAAKLEQGELPETRSINVGGQPVPAPAAPKSYGGGGFDWMSAIAIVLAGKEILTGGSGSRRGWPDGGGFDILPGPSSGGMIPGPSSGGAAPSPPPTRGRGRRRRRFFS